MAVRNRFILGRETMNFESKGTTSSTQPLFYFLPFPCAFSLTPLIPFIFFQILEARGKTNVKWICNNDVNSTLRYECDETFSDEWEFAARAEGEWCNHTCQKNVFSHEYRTKFYITRCENADFRTRSVCKTAFTHSEWYKQIFSLKYTMRISSANEEHFFHFATRWTVCTLARIVAGISPATIRCRWFCPPLRLIPVWSSKCHFTISKLFKHWTSWSSIPYAMFHRSVLQGTRGEATVVAVHFSNEERAYLCRCTSFPFYDAFCDCFLWLHSTDAQ